jgi:PAS domain S-box-containing protein
LAKKLGKKDKEILHLISQGKSDLDVCRAFGMMPDQLSLVLKRAEDWLLTIEGSTDEAFMIERALRRRAENALKSLEGRFAALLDVSPEAIFVVNAMTGIITNANQNAAELFGYDLRSLLGRSIEDLVPTRYRTIHPAYRVGFLTSARKRDMGYHPPIYGQKADGSIIEVAIALTAARSDEDVMVVCTEFSKWASGSEQTGHKHETPA